MPKPAFKLQSKQKMFLSYLITIPKENIDKEIDQKLKEIAPKANLTGFRPGKVPLSVLRIKYRDSLRGEVLQKLISEANEKLLKDENINPLTYPEIVLKKNDHDKDLEYEINIDEMPTIELEDLAKIKVNRNKVLVEDSQVDDTLAKLAKSNSNSEPVKKARKTKIDDIVVMDFVGKIDNKPFKGGSGEKFHYKLGSKRVIEDLEKGLIGIEVPFSGDIEVTFPADYQEKSLANKKAVFSVKVSEIREDKVPVINDDFASIFGLKDLAELKTHVVNSLETEYSKLSDQVLKQEIFDQLDKTFNFDLPKKMLNKEIDAIKQLQKKQPLDDFDKSLTQKELEKKYDNLAKRRVKLVCIIAKIVAKNNFSVKDEEISNAISAEAKSFQGREKEVLDYYQKTPDAKSRIHMQILENRAIDWLQSKISTEEKTISYDEITKKVNEAN